MENQGNTMKDIVLFSLYFQPNYCCYIILKCCWSIENHFSKVIMTSNTLFMSFVSITKMTVFILWYQNQFVE